MSSALRSVPARRPWLVLLWLALGVSALHFGLWQGVGDALAASAMPDRAQTAVQVRTVSPPAPALDFAATPLATPGAAPAARPAPPRRLTPPKPAPDTQKPEADMHAGAKAMPEPAVLVATAIPPDTAAPTAMAPRGASVEPTAPSQDDVPVYRTQIPPAMTLHYDMHRGAWGGTGELEWRPTASGYVARLEGRLAGFSILTWASQGGFDAAGLAPVRYTDKRRGKSEQAANFQRSAGKISFSGPSTEYPLLQGTQDRLSWMIQIAAIADADPQALTQGARVSMFVAGARGDADVWTFRVQGAEEVVTGENTVRAIKLLREPRKPHDTRVEVWLAPGLHHLPVRARLVGDGSALELRLQRAQPAT